MKKLILAAFLAISAIGYTQTSNYMNPDLQFNERAKDLVAHMTLQEKVSQMCYDAAAIPRLGIPAYNWWNECLHGVARSGLATVFPQAIGMASMWDAPLMNVIGTAISDEARAKHQKYVSEGKFGIYQGLTFWTPNINIFRDPRWGRGQETYGEDPYLTGELAVPFIKGLQGNDPKYLKLVATAKHFVMHSGPESERHRFNAIPTGHDFVETYAPHFERVVKDAHVYSIMCAYNRFENKPCCGNRYLSDLLRNEWGFKGYIVSDCWAVADFFRKDAHAVVPTREEASAMAVKAGTDLNCGDSYPSLVKAVNDGLVSESYIDSSVVRLMEARLRLGLFAPKGDVKYEQIPYSVVDSREHQDLALRASHESMVLLKNSKNTLPFSKSVKTVAVIGPNANDKSVLLGNYNGYPSNPVTVLEGIKAKLPNAKIVYAPGCHVADGLPILKAIPSSVLYTDNSKKIKGLEAEYFNNKSFSGTPSHKRVDNQVDFIWRTVPPFPEFGNEYSVRWKGVLVPPVSGKYAIGGEAFSGMKLYVDDSLFLSHHDVHESTRLYKYIDLKGGKAYKIRLEYVQESSEYANMQLIWEQPDARLEDEAVEAARKADIIIYCMGLSPMIEGEEMNVHIKGFSGGDRTDLALPEQQTKLMQRIEQLRKPSVMVMMNGGAIACNWENENLSAILEAWYPGQAGGAAVADVLFGDYNPSGRLPVTFYKSINDIPAFENYNMKGKTYRYFEGEPLYEFGYGLSYSTFEYSGLKAPDKINAGDSIRLSVNVKNTGKHAGDEVVQLYVSLPDSKYQVPIRSLKGFQRIKLNAGEAKEVCFTVSPSQMAAFDENNVAQVKAGRVLLSVGGKQPGQKDIETGKVLQKSVDVSGETFFPL